MADNAAPILTVARKILDDCPNSGVCPLRECELAKSVIDLSAALERLIPIARDAKHEDFSDLDGNEDSRTAAVKHAISILKGKP